MYKYITHNSEQCNHFPYDYYDWNLKFIVEKKTKLITWNADTKYYFSLSVHTFR